MVGFPGETDAEFEETLAFVERMPFTYLHVFPFSPREGTPAADNAIQISRAVKRERSCALRSLIARKNLEFRESFVGRRVSAVAMGTGEASTRALSSNFIDITLTRSVTKAPRITDIRIDSVEGRHTFGLPLN